jgi:hypothetical protein
MRGIQPPDWFVGDGCTCAPDATLLRHWKEACRWHDWCYRQDVECERWEADANLFWNLHECGAYWIVSAVYWLAVRCCGWTLWNKKHSLE